MYLIEGLTKSGFKIDFKLATCNPQPVTYNLSEAYCNFKYYKII